MEEGTDGGGMTTGLGGGVGARTGGEAGAETGGTGGAETETESGGDEGGERSSYISNTKIYQSPELIEAPFVVPL
jgi:hypothetical protein